MTTTMFQVIEVKISNTTNASKNNKLSELSVEKILKKYGDYNILNDIE